MIFQAVWVFSLIDYEPPTYHNGAYEYPWWAEAIGWGIASLSLMCIPAFAIYVIIRSEGASLVEVKSDRHSYRQRPILDTALFEFF